MQLLVSAAAYVTTAIVGLRVAGLRRMLRWADRPIGAAESEKAAEYAAIVLAVERAGRYIPGGSCLARSLALTRILRMRGVAAQTKIGVKTADGFHAHAWVEVEGVAVTSESGHEALIHD